MQKKSPAQFGGLPGAKLAGHREEPRSDVTRQRHHLFRRSKAIKAAQPAGGGSF